MVKLTKVLKRLSQQYPVGSLYSTYTNKNPSSWLGGKWELVNKDFAYKWVTDPVVFNTTNTTDGTSMALLRGNTIEIRIRYKNKNAISDTETVIGTLSASKIGLNNVSIHTSYFTGIADGLNAIAMLWTAVNTTNGIITISTVDYATRPEAYPTNSDYVATSFMMNAQAPSGMLDSFCDVFTWRRTQ